ncbi:MAG: hypothetical protein CMD92_07355 [Gammaproteobacteria bacterium]|nr:hypothetical protein [Gammaproteobacteria bacterium]
MKLEDSITKNEFDDMIMEGCILQSSGSTGTPKNIFQPPEKLRYANSIARQVQGITKDSKILTVCTLRHAGGLLAQTLPGYEVNAEIEVEKFNAFSWVRKIKDFTHSHLTPDMARAIMKTKSFDSLNLEDKIIMCGSDRVQSGIIQNFIDRGAIFIVNWGMTEVGPVAINRTFEPGMKVQTTETIMGNETHCDTKIVAGELYVKGDICVYDDWFATGDIVAKEDGHYYYMGRKSVRR